MILGSIANINTEKKTLPRAVVQGLEFLEKNNIRAMAPGRYDIDGDNLFVLIQDYTTVASQEKRPEAHDTYFDIQYIATGIEIIGWGIRSEETDVVENLLTEKDVIFFEAIQNETAIVLSTGMYAVFFPNDVHRPGCLYEQSLEVRKVVIKIKMSELES